MQRTTISRLDDAVFARHNEGRLPTGGTTLIVHVLTGTHVYTANVGDCKSVLSSRGACVELNTCHNPNVASERDRFQVPPPASRGVCRPGPTCIAAPLPCPAAPRPLADAAAAPVLTFCLGGPLSDCGDQSRHTELPS